ncbi:MAG TPA: PIN domain-containing protein [Candidatus Thermoplasmatota archaeon]
MTVVVDTGILAAALNTQDPRHDTGRALLARILRGEYGTPVSSEHVLDEGLTLLRTRGGRRNLSSLYGDMFLGKDARPPVLQMIMTSRDDLVRAFDIHLQHYDRKLSMTDCILAVLAQDLRAVLASFDGGFDGIVPRIAQ